MPRQAWKSLLRSSQTANRDSTKSSIQIGGGKKLPIHYYNCHRATPISPHSNSCQLSPTPFTFMGGMEGKKLLALSLLFSHTLPSPRLLFSQSIKHSIFTFHEYYVRQVTACIHIQQISTSTNQHGHFIFMFLHLTKVKKFASVRQM